MSGLPSISPQRLAADSCRLSDFAAIVEQPTNRETYPNSERVVDRVVIYDGDDLRRTLGMADGPVGTRSAILSEIAETLLNGPGITVFTNAFDEAAIDRVSDVFEEIIAEEKTSALNGGDHFAKAGANDRVWNALEKLALKDPAAFYDYYRSDILALVSEAWLGPGYQVTSQVNVVNPGGEAQQPHRDYHLGFMTNDEAERFPSHIHRLSPLLTLQGAVAHCDMPTETGPTMYLPHSQKYEAGYLAWRRPEFIEYFAEHHVQLSLDKGDAIFFNPAVFHAAGTNQTSDVRRMANLLQVSSAMGRAMEKIDRLEMSCALYPVIGAKLAGGDAPEAAARVIACSSEGYAFPASLDSDQPVKGLAPASQTDLVNEALEGGWPLQEVRASLTEQARTRAT